MSISGWCDSGSSLLIPYLILFQKSSTLYFTWTKLQVEVTLPQFFSDIVSILILGMLMTIWMKRTNSEVSCSDVGNVGNVANVANVANADNFGNAGNVGDNLNI